LNDVSRAATRFDVPTVGVYLTALQVASAVKRGLDQAEMRDQLDAIERRLDAVGRHLYVAEADARR
jgi:hypothetical protein